MCARMLSNTQVINLVAFDLCSNRYISVYTSVIATMNLIHPCPLIRMQKRNVHATTMKTKDEMKHDM